MERLVDEVIIQSELTPLQMYDICSKLIEYYNTGYTPDQIKEMDKTIDRLANIADHADNDRRQAVGEMEKWKSKYEVTISVIAKLRDWLKIEGIETERYLDYLVNTDSPTPTYVPQYKK